jgi:hypothetical protein
MSRAPEARMRLVSPAVISSLGVDRDRKTVARGHLQPFVEREIVGPRKLRQSRVAQEGFEPDDARSGSGPSSSRLPGTSRPIKRSP